MLKSDLPRQEQECTDLRAVLIKDQHMPQAHDLWVWIAFDPAANLLYSQLKKSYRRRRLARVERCLRMSDLSRLTDRLKMLGVSGTLNTAFVERINLTSQHALAALSRCSWATAQLTGELLAHLEW